MEAQLTFDAADRLVDLVEERRGPVAAEEAARALFALAFAPAGLARNLLDEIHQPVGGVEGELRLHTNICSHSRRPEQGRGPA